MYLRTYMRIVYLKRRYRAVHLHFGMLKGVVLILQAWFLSYRFLGPSNSREHPICAGDSCVLFCPGRWNRSLGPRSHHRLQATFQHVLESHPRKLGNAWKCKEFKRNITFQNARFPCGSVFFLLAGFLELRTRIVHMFQCSMGSDVNCYI